jgi:sigma-B regulation protein RsbU (phosphoserine phosphatase)
MKIVLLTIIPILLLSTFSILLLVKKINELNSSTAEISINTLHAVYGKMITDNNRDIKEKVILRMDSVLNELNILRAEAQRLIDHSAESPLERNVEYDPWIKEKMVYNLEKHWSNLADNEFNISMSVWGYLHNNDGSFNKKTIAYVSMMAPVKKIMQSIGENGTEKGWFYVTGPKDAPVMIMNPWAQMPKIFDDMYPGHNENNWWDFFFPGMIESWEKWVPFGSKSKNEKNSQITITPLYKDAGGTGLMVTIFAPLWNKERTKNFGAAAVDYNIKNITNIVKEERVGADGFTFLLQSNGDILDATPDLIKKLELSQRQEVGTGVEVASFNLKKSKIKELAAGAGDVQNISRSKVMEFTDSQGEKFLLAAEELMDYNLWDNKTNSIIRDKLYIISIIPQTEVIYIQSKIHNEIAKLSRETLIFLSNVSLLLALISILFAGWYALQSTKQIRAIATGINQVEEKNYAASIEVMSQDELGSLAITFNHMTGEISKAYRGLEKYALELEQKVQERTAHLEEANRKLEELSQIDGLTKIHNRRYFDEKIEEVWREYSRLKHPISIIMIDVDNFKKFNDYYGHQQGDVCLCAVASAIKDQLKRSSDSIARYGGEEFIVIACIDADDASILAEKMRLAVKLLAIEHKSSEGNIVTISLGVASTVPAQDKEINKLVKAADVALYTSKQKGKDMTTVKEYEI